MDACARGPGLPASDRSILRTARCARELGELYLSRGRLRAPRWRLHALLALIPAARTLGLSTRVMEPEVRSCLDAMLAVRRSRPLAELAARVRSWLGSRPGEGGALPAADADLLQGLAAALAGPGRSAPLAAARALLAAGWAGEARELAAGWSDPVIRRRLALLAATGVWGSGGTRRFVAEPFDEAFPPSLPRFVAMARASRPGAPLTGARLEAAEGLLARFDGAERQAALAQWAAASYHAGGLAAGARVARSIRYRRRRQEAWLRLLSASLEAGRLDDAWRSLERIEARSFRERGHLLLARELLRRGRRRRALRLLGEPVQAPRREELELLLCEIEPGVERVRRAWTSWRTRAPGPSEDLALCEPALPRLEHRWTILALRAALRRGLPGDDRRSVERVLWIPGRCFRALAHDRTALRAWLREVEAGPHALGPALHFLRWVAPDALEPIWSEHLTVRAARLGEPRREARDRPPGRIARAFARGLLAGPESPAGEAPAVSAERCATDEGISLSPHARQRRRVVLGAVKSCLGAWLMEGAEPPRGALSSRLRTLANLGGGLGVEHLERVLGRARRLTSSYREVFAALVSLAPERAARLAFHVRPALLLEHPGRARELLLALEDHGALDLGLHRPWGRFACLVRARLGAERGAAWLGELMAAWPGGPRSVPTFAALECCGRDLAGPWPGRGEDLVARARRRLEALLETPTPRLPAALLEDPVAVQRLLWLRPGPGGSRPPNEHALNRDLATLRDDLGEVDVPSVLRLARVLAPRRARALARRFLLGSHPVAEASRIVDLPGPAAGPRHRLRFLDKRRDLLAFLRFADCVPCCFDSASFWYRHHGMGVWVLALWKDPLSFCFHVERAGRHGAWAPCGFVFGGYSLGASDPALLVNGVYLRRQDARLRAAVLRAIEETFCRPLTLRRLAVANRHGGHGEMPTGYLRRPATIHRLRALGFPGGPARYIYDDVSSAVNHTVCVDHLYWKAIR